MGDAGVDVTVSVGGSPPLCLSVQADCRVGDLKQRLEAKTGILARRQKLIFKGKVLEDNQLLGAYRIAHGAKLMLLASNTATPSKAHTGLSKATAPQQKQRTVASIAGKPPPSTSISSSSGGSMAERRAMWARTGIIGLRDAGLTHLDDAVFDGLPNARAADLSGNMLPALPAGLRLLSALATLRAGGNALTDAGLPWEALGQLAGLTRLTLAANQLRSLPPSAGRLSGLVQLSLADNQVEEVADAALEGLVSLQVLDLSGNRLTCLPLTIGCCLQLVEFDASSNQLAELPPTLAGCTKLAALRLNSNRLRALPPQLLPGCSSLAALEVHDNPLTVEALRGAPGFAEFDARRRARASKQLGGRVMADVERMFSEGADVQEWQHWRPTQQRGKKP